MKKPSLALSCASMLLSVNVLGAEVATDPGDISPLPEDTNLGIVYYQHTIRDAYHVNGNKLDGSNKLDTDIGLLRVVHFMKIDGFLANPQIVLPFGSANLKSNSLGLPFNSKKETGVGDPLVGGSFWIWQRPESKESIEVTGFFSIPAGSYEVESGPINIGENRWKAIGHIGYSRAITQAASFDVVAEVTKYGDNDKFLVSGLEKSQANAQSLMLHTKYALTPQNHVGLSYYHDFGGETSLNGVKQDDKMNNSRWLLTYANFITTSTQLQVQYGKSIKVQNGFNEDNRVNLRLLTVF